MTKTKTITLDQPIQRGDTQITAVDVRKPQAGELRGLALSDLFNIDVNAVIKVLPRITAPSLTEHEVAGMDPADLMQLGGAVAGFLLPRGMLEETPSPTA